jgi:hypothetical protein
MINKNRTITLRKSANKQTSKKPKQTTNKLPVIKNTYTGAIKYPNGRIQFRELLLLRESIRLFPYTTMMEHRVVGRIDCWYCWCCPPTGIIRHHPCADGMMVKKKHGKYNDTSSHHPIFEYTCMLHSFSIDE